MVSLNFVLVRVKVEKSAAEGTTVASAAAPLDLTVIVVLLLGFCLASSTLPSGPLIVAVSHSCVFSELCKKPVGAVTPNVLVTPKVGMCF